MNSHKTELLQLVKYYYRIIGRREEPDSNGLHGGFVLIKFSIKLVTWFFKVYSVP